MFNGLFFLQGIENDPNENVLHKQKQIVTNF